MPALHPLAERILKERDIDDVESFLNPEYDTRPDPFLLKNMDRAVERILSAIENKETIAAWTDYDCDGIPAGALLSDFFREVGYPLISYIPDRSEGYGLNEKGIAALKGQGVTLIITADVGITNNDEVVYAKELGIDVIVTDHHLPGEVLPPAYAVINPHQRDCPYSFKELSGTGVAFKLVEALVQKGNFGKPKGFEKWFLDIVALATIADMMPLVGENRTLVHFGMFVMKKGKRKGLVALLEKARVNRAHITEDDISFSVAPKINASSRMASPKLALELLTTEDDERANELAKQLVKLNDARKLEGARVSKEIKQRMSGVPLDDVIVIGNPSWKPALLGIAATNIVETYERTVCLWGRDGDVIKGSCRSNGSVNIVSLMSAAGDLFEDYGGHELSGGFSLKHDAVHTLPQTLQKVYASLDKSEGGARVIEADSKLTLSEVTDSSYRALRALAPFGIGNKKPIFHFSNIRIEKILWFGKHDEHVRLTISEENGVVRDAIGFFAHRAPYKHEVELLSHGDVISLHASLEQSFFGRKKELRLRIETLSLA